MKASVKSVMLLSLAGVCVACTGTSKKSGNTEVIVNIAQAKNSQSDSGKEFSFISKPYRTSELSFRVSGPVDQLDVYAGNYYKQGDIIAQIDPRDFSIRRERAEAVYNQARAEADRIEILYKKNNISASAYEKAKADCTTAKTALHTATNELGDTKLTAPFNGYIGAVYIEKFQDVKATQPIVSLVDLNQLKIEAYVTQDIAVNASQIKTVALVFDALPRVSYTARVAEISRSTTQNNLSYLLTAILPNSDGKLLAGMSGKVSFDATPCDTIASTVTIPQIALCHRPTKGDYVWVVDTETGIVNSRDVTLGELQRNGTINVTEGLATGEIVATSGLRFLSDGMIVKTSESVTEK